MPPEILALIDKPLSLIAVLFVGALAGMMVEQFVAKQKRAKWRRKYPRPVNAQNPMVLVDRKLPVADAADQLRTVMKADFKPQALLNKSEARLFKALENATV